MGCSQCYVGLNQSLDFPSSHRNKIDLDFTSGVLPKIYQNWSGLFFTVSKEYYVGHGHDQGWWLSMDLLYSK